MHIHGTTIHPFHVDQIDSRDVRRSRVASIRSTAQRQRRQVRVVDVADTALRGRLIYQDPASRHPFREFLNHFFIIRVDDRGVTHAAELNDFQSTFDALFRVFHFVASEYRAQFLSRQREFRTHAFDFSNENFRSSRHVDAAHFRDFYRRLADDRRIHCTFVGDDRACSQLRSFIFINEITTVGDHFLLHLVENRFFNNDCLLGCTNHAVVERFGKDQVVDRLIQVCALFNEARNVTRANTQCRFAAAISGFNHCGSAGSQDAGDVMVIHQSVRAIHGRIFDPLDAIGRCAVFNGSFEQYFSGFRTAGLSGWMETENDRVTCFDGDQRFKDGG
ncbi:hypothetical protein D3C81_885840 [compost metagenome]